MIKERDGDIEGEKYSGGIFVIETPHQSNTHQIYAYVYVLLLYMYNYFGTCTITLVLVQLHFWRNDSINLKYHLTVSTKLGVLLTVCLW